MAPAGVCEDALQDLVPDRCRPAREPLGNSWPRRSWGAIRSVKHRVTPGCRADGCTNPVLPLRCRNQKVRNHKTIILLLKMRAVNAKLHDLCSHPRGTQASPDVLSNGSLPMAAALTYQRAVCPSPWARFRYTSFMSPVPGSNKHDVRSCDTSGPQADDGATRERVQASHAGHGCQNGK